ncbi:MAG TPA: T9SS type A sorting domain-containing protein, partial [Bacteroidetes bacterium]|nr:T9SS type A sorting domain-containing protein [Bacteroidota bacterium]
VLTINVIAQNWTEPVNVSNMGGFNQLPDYCFDDNGVIHCVWVHVYETNFSKIFYSKSYDDGLTWTTGEDISLNEEKRLSQPHIVCDSENNIHLTYDYDTGNYLETLVYYKKFNGTNWSESFVVSENMPESHANKLVIDNNDRIYCFWFRILYNNGTTFYRYMENGEWSDIFIPYDNNDYFPFLNCDVDSDNNLHWIGAHYYEWQTAYEIKPVYFYYNYGNDEWSDFVKFGERYSWYGFDIDLDVPENPHLVWQEFTNDSIPPNDGTFYTYYDGDNWKTPELIVEDPKNQQIVIDNYNNPNIFDIEKYENGHKILFYYFSNSIWNGYVLDETQNAFFDLNAKKNNNQIYIFYTKSLMIEEGQIYYSKMDMMTGNIKIHTPFNKLKLFPNPFKNNLTISFELKFNGKFQLKIYTIQGKLINTLIDENNAPGRYQIMWNGTDKNGKEVNSGLYLIRLQAGRQVMTRSVEIIK